MTFTPNITSVAPSLVSSARKKSETDAKSPGHGGNTYQKLEEVKGPNEEEIFLIMKQSRPRVFIGGLIELESPKEIAANGIYASRLISKTLRTNQFPQISMPLNHFSKLGSKILYDEQHTIYNSSAKLYAVGRANR